MSFPPPPWPMVGPFLLVPRLLGRAAARALLPDALHGGPAVGLVLLGDWREGSALRYGELAGLVGPVWRRGRMTAWVTSMHVDDAASQAGGRAIWGVPKELARFERDGETREVRDAQDRLLLRARWPMPRRLVALPASGSFAGAIAGPLRRAALRGSLRAAPVVARLEVPDDSPLAPLGVSGRRPALAGLADLRAEAPRTL